MNLERAWAALTKGERIVLATSLAVALLLGLGGLLLVGGIPFQPAQTSLAGSDIVDTNGDGLADAEELLVYGTDPTVLDSSGDGLPDAWAARHMRLNPDTGLPSPDPSRNTSNEDPVGSGLTNLQEYQLGTDPWKKDTSGDGFHDGWLHQAGLDPTQRHDPDHVCSDDGMTLQEKWDHGLKACSADSANNGLYDIEEIEGRAELGGQALTFSPTDPAKTSTGGSGLPDGFAVYHGLDPHDSNLGRQDHSGDGMTAAQEARWSIERFDGDVRRAIVDGLDITDPDTSDNGIPDAWAIRHGLDPLDPDIAHEDPSGSGLTNLEEYRWGTDPNKADTSGNGLLDGEEVEGWTITVDGQERHVSSNPLLVDSSGDGMTDYEAKHGQIEIDGEVIEFPPVDPMLPDTSGDGLTDYATLAMTFGPNDERLNVTLSDTSGSGIPDGLELAYWVMRENAVENGEWPTPSEVTPPDDVAPYVQRSLFERFQATYGDFPEHAGWPENLEPPQNTDGDCYEAAEAAIQAQDVSVLGPDGDLSGDCIPNVLSPTAAHNAQTPDLPPRVDALTDGAQIDPPERLQRTLPATDPALVSTSGDALLDVWEIRWARYTTDAGDRPTWLPDPTKTDSFGDGIPDAEDSWPGKAPDTSRCWANIAYDDDPHRDATGAGPPWEDAFTNVDEQRIGTDPFACDTSEDGLNDGWAAQYEADHADIDPLTPLDDAWQGAIIQTVCYPGSASNPELPDPQNHPNIDANPPLDELPPTGPVDPTLAEDLDDALLPPSDPRSDEPSAWALPGQGCQWTGEHAQPGDQCQECRVVGMVVTLEMQQWHKTNPTRTDSSQDGAPDAWKILWYQLAPVDLRDLVRPDFDEHDPVGDGLSMEDTHELGCSPLVDETIRRDGIPDGDADSCLAADELSVPLRDAVGDHLIDHQCDGEGSTFSPPGTYQATPDEAKVLRDLQIVEVDENTFLCQPRDDFHAEHIDANSNEIPDALELIHYYNEHPDERPQLFRPADVRDDLSGNGLSTRSELTLGQPADWPPVEVAVWWFGSNPYTDTGYDADGDGLAEALFLDPDPFTNLPQTPTPENAWQLACQTGIVCHDTGDAYDWASAQGDTSLTVTLDDVGEERGGERLVTKGQPLPATVEVTGPNAAGTPVALMALDWEAAEALEDDDSLDLSVLAQPEHVICIEHTDGDGTLDTSACLVESTTTTTDLTNTDRSWLGTSTPAWDRSFPMLDPTDSHDNQGTSEGQPRIVAWAMGTGEDTGAVATQPVLVEASTDIAFEDLPETATSDTQIPIRVSLTDAAGDPLQGGTVELTLAGETYTQDVDDDATVTFQDVQAPRVDDADDFPLTATYSHAPATFVASSTADEDLRVLPTPDISLVPPSRAIAGDATAAEVTVTDGDTPVQGPINVTLGPATTQATTDQNGEALVRLEMPRDVRPGTQTLTATFEGTSDHGVASTRQDVPVNQRFNATLTPEAATLNEDQPFSVEITDLAGRAPMLDVNVTLTLGDETATTTLPQGNTLTAALLPVTGAIGDTHLTINANTEQNRRYEPLDQENPLHVTSPGTLSLTTDTVPRNVIPRGSTVDVIATATDDLDRPIPEAMLHLEWPHGETTLPVREGQATVPLHVPSGAPAEPMRVDWRLEGPGLEASEGTQQLGVLVETTLEANATLDAASGTVNVPIRLADDRGDPVSDATVLVNWALGEAVPVETGGGGEAEATLVIPETAEPGDHEITATFQGDQTYLATEAHATVPVRQPATFDLPETVTWNEGRQLAFSGSVLDEATSEVVNLPVAALHGGDTVAQAPPQDTFQLTLDAGTVSEMIGDASDFTLTLSTPGDDRYAPAQGSVNVERQVPVDIATGINRTDDGAIVTIQAHTPRGALANADLGVGGEGTPPTTVTTDGDGEATIRLSEAAGTLVVRYAGDDQHAPSQATVSMAQPAAPAPADLAWVAFALVAALLIVDAWIVYRVVQRIRVGRQVESVLQELEDRLVVGDEVQASIYRAYMQLRATAEVLGEPEHETETVREFGNRFVNRLALKEDPVMGLINIFEEAWYGRVDASMRTDAIKELRRLQTHLRDRGLVA